MANKVTDELENKIIKVMKKAKKLEDAVIIDDLYTGSASKTTIEALATDATPATVSTKLTKDQYKELLTMIKRVPLMLNGTLSGQLKYRDDIDEYRNADAVLAAPLSKMIETIAERSMVVAGAMMDIYELCLDIQLVHTHNEIGTAFASVSDYQVVYGASMTVKDLKEAMEFCDNWVKFMEDDTPALEDYRDNIYLWERFLTKSSNPFLPSV